MTPWVAARDVPSDDLEDLSSFTELSVDECRRKLAEVDKAALEKEWIDYGARTDQDVVRFFATSEPLLWAHLVWHYSHDRSVYARSLERLVQDFPPSAGYANVLDFGCGVGTDSLFLTAHGYRCTLADLDGPMFRFAKHRFARRHIGAAFVESASELPSFGSQFDVILCLDVFEHLADPLAALDHLLHYLRPGGLLVQFGNFDDIPDIHPEALANGAGELGNGAWERHVLGKGMRRAGDLVYQDVSGLYRRAQVLRGAVWRATGIWLRAPRGGGRRN